MDFELQFGKRGGPGRRNPGDGARRILVLGDFAGRAARGEVPAREPLASRPLVRAPQEGAGVDAALEALAPALALPPSIAGATPTLELHALEDFHPDALFRRLAVFRDPPRAAVAPAAAPAAAGKNDADDIERLLGKRPAAAAVSATSAVDDLIRPIIAGHVASAPPDAPLDAVALGRIMRALLHQPAFQALEARWRALELLVSRADEAVEIIVLDVTRAELLADLLPGRADAASDPTLDGSALARRVLSPPGGRPFAALIGDFAFGPGAEDAALLGRLGALAAAAGAPFVAGAAGPPVTRGRRRRRGLGGAGARRRAPLASPAARSGGALGRAGAAALPRARPLRRQDRRHRQLRLRGDRGAPGARDAVLGQRRVPLRARAGARRGGG